MDQIPRWGLCGTFARNGLVAGHGVEVGMGRVEVVGAWVGWSIPERVAARFTCESAASVHPGLSASRARAWQCTGQSIEMRCCVDVSDKQS